MDSGERANGQLIRRICFQMVYLAQYAKYQVPNAEYEWKRRRKMKENINDNSHFERLKFPSAQVSGATVIHAISSGEL